MAQLIAKVQQSLYSSTGIATMLIYDHSRRIQWQGPLSPQVQAALGNAPKGYFHARLSTDGCLELLDRAPDQTW